MSAVGMTIAAIMAFMRDILRGWPKAELHLHLEGSLEPSTVCEIDPHVTEAEVRERYQFTDFPGFLQSYIWVNRKLTVPQHFGIATRRLLESLEHQGVVHLELNLSVGVMLWKEQDVDAMLQAIFAETERSRLTVGFIFDAIRQFGPEHVQRVAELAVRYRDRGVVGFGIGGDELRGPASLFQTIFDWVRSQGLHAVPHAGETDGPQSIWAALELGAKRIGHGIRAIEDPLLMAHLRDQDIPLEVSLTSNVRTGVVASYQAHPLRKLFDAGVPIVLNTDDPEIFGTTLLDEYELAARHQGFTLDELKILAGNSLKYRLAQSAPAPATAF
jgi:aminodeoxyfutalosine deaminase